MLKVLKWPTPPFSSVLKLVVELVLVKSVRFVRYRTFWVFLFHGHFDLIAVLFLIFGDDLPPHFEVFWMQWCEKILLEYHHLEDMGGGFDFSVPSWLFLYIWYAHYARSARGWGLFDHQKETVVRGCFSVVRGCICWFFHFLLLFVTFFTARNFCKLLFPVESGKV
jgi:hypothetical protein